LQLATQSQVDAAEKAASDAASALKALDALGGNAATNTLTAPFDSVVAGVPVAQGDRVQAGATILQLARTDSLRVQIGIDPAQSRRVRPGTPATLVPIAITSDHPTPIAVTVASVQDMVDPKTQLVNAIVSLPRQVGVQLVPGMKVRAALQVGKRTALAVPRDAVLSDSQGDYVYQVSGGKAHRVPVSKQLEADGYVGIAGLRDPALPVVTVGNYELQDGMAVKATP
ncbi:MAG: efflux RND transporter periplasmic adaptor subunit, partial [Pseudomonadota bacterium]|nr:efflux RND transporter periplasmic adaptor subunit [Pseudomonadota bacterium]